MLRYWSIMTKNIPSWHIRRYHNTIELQLLDFWVSFSDNHMSPLSHKKGWLLNWTIISDVHSVTAYRQVSNISRTLVGNWIVDHSNVVGASPVGAAPTTSSFSTYRVPTRSLFPGKVLTFDNGSLGPGKVLSFSSFKKKVLEKSLFSNQTQVGESMLDVKY